MAVPKRKLSKSKRRMRVAANDRKRRVAATVPCPTCKAPHEPHRICPQCGQYRGRQVLVLTDKD